jgi:hypothetical protein
VLPLALILGSAHSRRCGRDGATSLANSSGVGAATATVETSRIGGGVVTMIVELTAEQLVELADLVADRLRGVVADPGKRRLATADELAVVLGMAPTTVRQHAVELGGVRVGSGVRPRWRFDVDQALAAWTARYTSEESHEPKSPASVGVRRRSRSSSMGNDARLLPVRGRSSRQIGGERS